MMVGLPLVSLHYCGRNQVYLDPVILLIKVQGGVALVAGLSAKIIFSGLERVSIGIVIVSYQTLGRGFFWKVSILLAYMVTLIQITPVFVPYVGYPVQKTFYFVLTFFKPLNSCSLRTQINNIFTK